MRANDAQMEFWSSREFAGVSCSEGFTVQIDSIKHLSARQKTGIHGVIPYGEFLYLTSAASYPITSGMSTMTYTMR